MEGTRHDRNISRKHQKRRRITLILLSVVLIAALGVTAYGYFLYVKAEKVATVAHKTLTRGSKSDLRTAKVDPVKDNFSILFIGIDKRENEPSRSDALVLATFNHENNQVKMVSIPRDSKVQIIDPTQSRDYGETKITHAHAFGDANDGQGADYTIATVEHLFQVPVDYYVQVDFQAFVRIIDALDGVTVDVPVKLVTQNSHDQTGKNKIVLEPGKQNLNGEQALAFVRNRKSPGSGSDFGRGRRQMAVIQAIAQKSKQITSVGKYGQVMDSLSGHFETNLTFGQLVNLTRYAAKLQGTKTMQLKGSDNMSTGVYYYALDDLYLQKVRTELRRQLDLPATSGTESSNPDSAGSADTNP
ncbi:LCP family protein [Sporolactobacillus vineae]|uniref:LCP family protein n=1 Tax=Sporolactobacillus vineae TaxID=444463 RepID=UPI0002882B04|nr:LCP family protein [Sporolactobacillus vineae]